MGAGSCSCARKPHQVGPSGSAWAAPETLLTRATAVLLGLQGGGKSTVVEHLYRSTFCHVLPTLPDGARRTTVACSDRLLELLDVSGTAEARPQWVAHTVHADAIVFVIDASDVLRLPLAWAELTRLVHSVERARQVPLLVLLNKMDLPNAVTTTPLREGMSALRPIAHSDWCIAEVSAATGEGLKDAFAWLLRRVGEPHSAP
eukprot:GGOE01061094.1.p2 GENE.GGOE01061094.1~~GGOE01061094.1.p2  ORF type:complete len:203 (-),score=36.86 GGOE01061094.1:201-809(-)